MIVDQIEPQLDEVIIVSYEGDYNVSTGAFEGHASAVLDNDCKYDGDFKNGMFHGKGVFHWSNGVKFEGDFLCGQLDGHGTYTWHDESTYTGSIKAGLRHGTGKFVGSCGQVYDGQWQNGKRHGSGKMFYNEDCTVVYTGDWEANLRHGYGVMKYASGNSYEGHWAVDKKCGTGVMIWRDVDELYTGEWKDDLPHGSGEHIWGESGARALKRESCNMYRGQFCAGQRQGYGTFFYMNGSQYTGEWEANAKQGEGLFFYPDGRIYGGLFENNRMLSQYAAEESAAPRATDAVNAQYRLHIRDVYARFPQLLTSDAVPAPTNPVVTFAADINTASSSSNRPSSSSVSNAAAATAAAGAEMERLLLKYNHYLHATLRRYTEIANRRRLTDVLQQHQALANWVPEESNARAHKACLVSRMFQKRLSGMNVENMLRFLREVGVVGPYFRSFDLGQCILQMRQELEVECLRKLREYRQRRKQMLAQEAEEAEALRLQMEAVALAEEKAAARAARKAAHAAAGAEGGAAVTPSPTTAAGAGTGAAGAKSVRHSTTSAARFSPRGNSRNANPTTSSPAASEFGINSEPASPTVELSQEELEQEEQRKAEEAALLALEEEKERQVRVRDLNLHVPTLMDAYLHAQAQPLPAARRAAASFHCLAEQPLRERECVELLVRALAVKFGRGAAIVEDRKNQQQQRLQEQEQGAEGGVIVGGNNNDIRSSIVALPSLKGMSLTQILYFNLANKLLPMVSDWDENIPAFYRDFYYEEVQALLLTDSGELSAEDEFEAEEDADSADPVATGGGSSAAAAAAAAAANAASVRDEQKVVSKEEEPKLTFFQQLWAKLLEQAEKAGGGGTDTVSMDSDDEARLGLRDRDGVPLPPMHQAGPRVSEISPTAGSITLGQLVQFFTSAAAPTVKGVLVSEERADVCALLYAMECAPVRPNMPIQPPSPPPPVEQRQEEQEQEGPTAGDEGKASEAPEAASAGEGSGVSASAAEGTGVEAGGDGAGGTGGETDPSPVVEIEEKEEQDAMAVAAAATASAKEAAVAQFDLSVLAQRIDFYDFLELLCRVVGSDLWVYKAPPSPSNPSTSKPASASSSIEGGDGDAGASVEMKEGGEREGEAEAAKDQQPQSQDDAEAAEAAAAAAAAVLSQEEGSSVEGGAADAGDEMSSVMSLTLSDILAERITIWKQNYSITALFAPPVAATAATAAGDTPVADPTTGDDPSAAVATQ